MNNSGAAASFGDASAGNISATSVGTLALLPNSTPAVLGRDKDGLYAMTITCTHQGCDVSPTSGNSLYCPCHGSTFDSNGNVKGGPAPSPLAHFAVSIDASGAITVHGGTQVAASVRTAVPV
ncbi:MAG: Rieske (2Fe-2S) protein [Polyangiaceae bacterium]